MLVDESCQKLKLGKEVCNPIKVLLKELYDKGFCCRKPGCIVGASIFLICKKSGIEVPKRRIALASDVSELSLRRACEYLTKKGYLFRGM